jgi:hypothetical protein
MRRMRKHTFLPTLLIVVSASSCGNHYQSDRSGNIDSLNSNENRIEIKEGNSEVVNNRPVKETEHVANVAINGDYQNESTVKTIILGEISRKWIGDDGIEYKLTKKSERKMLKLLIPIAEKQYNFSFDAQSEKIAELCKIPLDVGTPNFEEMMRVNKKISFGYLSSV